MHIKQIQLEMTLLKFFFFLFVIVKPIASAPQKLRCPLTWVAVTFGELPRYAVPVASFNQEHFVARFKSSETQYIGGRIANDTKLGYFPRSGDTTADVYEVLTNPNRCSISWGPVTSLSVPVSASQSTVYIGRASENNQILSGQLQNGNSLEVAIDDTTTKPYAEGFEILSSFSEGLHVEVRNFRLLNNVHAGNLELIAMEEIHNRAGVEAQQVLVHRNTVTETKSFTSANGYGASVSVSFKVDIGIKIPLLPTPITVGINIGFGLDYEYSAGYEESLTCTEVKEREISITRQISVPPYSSVQACTLVTMVEDFSFDYEAEDKFTAPGLSSADVKQLLLADGITGGVEEDDAVIITRRGNLAGTLAANTRFLVVPIEADNEGSCSIVQRMLLELKMEKQRNKGGSKISDKLRNQINTIVYGQQLSAKNYTASD